MWSPLTLSTVYSSTSRRFDLYSLPSPSRRINIGHWFANNFIWMGRRHHYKQQIIIQTLDEYTFGVRRGKWREIFRKKGLSSLREWVFSPATGPQESKNRLEKHWQYWEKHSPDLLNTLSIEGPVTSKKVKRRLPIQSKELWIPHYPKQKGEINWNVNNLNSQCSKSEIMESFA